MLNRTVLLPGKGGNISQAKVYLTLTGKASHPPQLPALRQTVTTDVCVRARTRWGHANPGCTPEMFHKTSTTKTASPNGSFLSTLA